MSAGMALEARNLRRSFRTGFSLDVDTLAVAAGKTLALLGPSGSGKSTLLSLLGLLERPDAGTVLLDGTPVTARDRTARLAMAAVFQRPYLIKGTVATNVAYGLKLRAVAAGERDRRVQDTLARVGLADMATRSAATLSGGEAQRVALARALVLAPRVLLLDEPLSSLDPLLKRRLTAEFASILRQEDMTVVWVTHDHDEAAMVADYVAIMNEGRIVSFGPMTQVMSLPDDDWTARFLGVEMPLSGRVLSSSGGMMSIGVGVIEIAAVGDIEPGRAVLVSIPPEDVILLAPDEQPFLSSARNRLDATVDGIDPRGATMRLTLQLGGALIAATVSRTSFQEMGLAESSRLGVLFKATAVRVRQVQTGSRTG